MKNSRTERKKFSHSVSEVDDYDVPTLTLTNLSIIVHYSFRHILSFIHKFKKRKNSMNLIPLLRSFAEGASII